MQSVVRIAYAFTKSDYKTIIGPVMPVSDFLRPHVLTEAALIEYPGSRGLGISLSLALIIYNELGLNSYWYTKNILNAIGIVSWNVGGAKIAALDSRGDNQVHSSQIQMSGLPRTWDFRDEKGDRLQGRITFPVGMPEFSRYMTFILIVSWSVGLSIFWRVPITAAVLFIMFGLYLAGRVVVLRSENQDKVSLCYYMLWLALGQVLPFFMAHLASYIGWLHTL
ncbi:hypothetical protein C8J56DRAFT_897374 [Mycena floridula]|nr:hypothetical protein C8J56DRAFT_897374 [Mycena floridula]